MGRQFKYLLVTLLLIIVQNQATRLLTLEGISPDILTIWIVYIALTNNQFRSTIWGFVIGLLFDLSSGNFIGLSALSKTTAGFIAGYFYGENKSHFTLGNYRFVLVVFIVSLVHNIVYFTLFTRGTEISFWQSIFQVGLGTTFYTTAVTFLPMFYFSRKYSRHHG